MTTFHPFTENFTNFTVNTTVGKNVGDLFIFGRWRQCCGSETFFQIRILPARIIRIRIDLRILSGSGQTFSIFRNFTPQNYILNAEIYHLIQAKVWVLILFSPKRF